MRPHRTAGRLAAQRCSAGTGSGSRRGAASVTPPDTGGWRGLAGAAAVSGEATAAPTSFSGHARRTRKAPRRALGGRCPRASCRPRAPSASLRGLASGGGTGRGSLGRPDLSSPGRPPRRGTFSRPSVCWRSPSAALYLSNYPGARSLIHLLTSRSWPLSHIHSKSVHPQNRCNHPIQVVRTLCCPLQTRLCFHS